MSGRDSAKRRTALRRRFVADVMLTGQKLDAIHEMWNRHAEQQQDAGREEYRTVHRSTISRDMAAIYEDWRAETRRSTEAWIGDTLATLAAAQARIMAQVMSRNTTTRDLHSAIDRLIRLLDQRNRILGLYAPDRVVIMDAELDAELDRLRSELPVETVAEIEAALSAVSVE